MKDESLFTSVVYRNLDSKIKIVGLEALDLIVILLIASVMNLIFGQTPLALYFVFLLPTFLGALLYFGKRNKPDNFLVHFLKYYLEEGLIEANSQNCELNLQRKIYDPINK